MNRADNCPSWTSTSKEENANSTPAYTGNPPSRDWDLTTSAMCA